MGCCSGATTDVAKMAVKEKEDNTLTDKRKGMVRESWKKAMGLGEEAVGVLLFRNLFTIAPQALELFSFYEIHQRGEDIYETAQLKAHATGVVATVSKAVDLLDDLDTLVPIL